MKRKFYLILIFVLFLTYSQVAYGEPLVPDKVRVFNQRVLEDILNTHVIDLTDKEEVSRAKLENSLGDRRENLFLVEKLGFACYETGCIGLPRLFMNENHAHILYKDGRGQNIHLTLKRTNKKWKLVDKAISDGSTMGIYD
ncbi:hypothetical protein IM538_04010 [Cytobacillus suaedae]|nr:hypothetical protein IM538_04010 [Cytobacillus suaedae]